MRKMMALVECLPTGTEFASHDLVYMADASFVAGRPEDLYRLRLDLRQEAAVRLRERLDVFSELSEDAQDWLVSGEQCISSSRAFYQATGVVAPCFASHDDLHSDDWPPRTSRSFYRVSKLIRQVPEVKDAREKLKDISFAWEAVMWNYDALENHFLEETRGQKEWEKHSPGVERKLAEILCYHF